MIEQITALDKAFQPPTVEDPHALLHPLDILQQELQIQRHERIPVSSLILEASLVDPAHVASLQESMSGNRGQISPITIRARYTEERKLVYDIIDGFHRSNGLQEISRMQGEEMYADAIVVYGCSDEELFDLRVLAANSVASVKFARMAEWMHSSYKSVQWSTANLQELTANGSLTIAQVFSLASQNSSGSYLGLSSEEAEEVKNWARAKAGIWNKPVGSIALELRTVEVSDPGLVAQVRKGGGGKGGRGVLTHARLKAIADKLPYQYELQQKLARLAVSENLVSKELKELVDIIVDAQDRRDFEAIQAILQTPREFLGEIEELSIDMDELDQTPMRTKPISQKPTRNGELEQNMNLPAATIERRVESIKTVPKREWERTPEEDLDAVRLAEVVRVQKAMIQLFRRQQSGDFPNQRIMDAMLGTLEYKLSLLDNGIEGFNGLTTLDAGTGIVFNTFKGLLEYPGVERIEELSPDETDMLWLLTEYAGQTLDYKTINFLLQNKVVVSEVITSLCEKLNAIGHGLGDRIKIDANKGYSWTT